MTRDHFIFYRSFYEAINKLPPENQLQVYKTVMEYALNGEILEVDAVTSALFTVIRPQIDANNKRYENGCKGAAYGKKGGAPKGNQNARKITPNQPQNNGKTTRNDNVNGNVNKNANDNVPTIVGNINERNKFCSTYEITADAEPPPDMDFVKLAVAYSESTFLQNPDKPQFRRMSWIIKNYDKLLTGHFKDYQKNGGRQQPPPTKKYTNKYIVEDD